MARKFAAVVFSIGCLQASSVMALGLGELTLDSFLNEPLNASVDLLNMGGLHQDEIRVRLGTRADFDSMGLDRAYFLTNIQFEIQVDDNGRARIILSSDEPVLEPYLDFIVEARWPEGRMLREYTVLVDPPVFSAATPVVSASERVETVEGIPAPAKKKEGGTATSGTHVAVPKSELAPGTMPQRGYNSTTSSTMAPGSRYMISRDDTLWDIASQAKPEGVSVYQTMLDIQRLNPDAFIHGNINRIKAGYIVYLPSADDISSANLEAALAEVSEQNAAWREGRDAQTQANKGPSLSISADADEEGDTVAAGTDSNSNPADEALTATQQQSGGGVAAGSEDVSEDGAQSDHMADMEHQLVTLQRIVTLKDEQIAALQNALAEVDGAAGDGPSTDLAPVEGPSDSPVADQESMPDEAAEEAQVIADESATEVVEESMDEELVEVEEVVAVKPASDTTTKPETGGGPMDYLLYILGAAALAIVGFVLARRGRHDEDDAEIPGRTPASTEDAFTDVQLKDPRLEVEAVAQETVAADDAADKRGYGGHKHDEYATDVDAADALAEADIYIAYGRHSQAIDLLNNALVSEPDNSVYRLKLLEIHTEANNYGAAAAQMEKLQKSGDPDSIARAEALMEGVNTTAASAPADEPPAVAPAPQNDGPGLSANPLELIGESDDDLEADFSGLEIEGMASSADVEDDLDLSSDFVAGSVDDSEEEELLIAADSNGLSTKLDLARAYIDMGDEDGARQILEEVVAEGTEELKSEARTLLDRIG